MKLECLKPIIFLEREMIVYDDTLVLVIAWLRGKNICNTLLKVPLLWIFENYLYAVFNIALSEWKHPAKSKSESVPCVIACYWKS